jgi:copper(I)-binding protein
VREEPVNRRRFGVGVAVILTVLLTAACAQGKQAQTAHESPAIDGINSDIGSIALRNIFLATPTSGPSYAAGAAVELSLVIVNTGSSDDNLISITTPAASAVSIFGNVSDAAPALSATAGATDSSAASTATASASASSSPPTASAVPFPVAVAAGQRASFGITDADKVLVLSGLLKQLYPANQIPITFTFQNAGTATLMVPVQLSTRTSSPLVIPSVTGAP